MDPITIAMGLGSSLLGGGINYIGNKIGLSQVKGQAESQRKAVQDALGMAAEQAPNFLINTNAAGQKGNAARIGYQKAEGGFAPDASLVQERAGANRMAGEMQDTLGQRTQAEARMRQIQQNRTATQIGDMAGMTGGNARAMNDVTRGIGEQVAQSNLQGNEQIGQQAVRTAGMGQDMRMQGGQAYQQGVAQQYQRDVVPYMNQFQNMEGLAAATAQSSYQGAQDSLINNPFQTVGAFANSLGGGIAGKIMENGFQPGQINKKTNDLTSTPPERITQAAGINSSDATYDPYTANNSAMPPALNNGSMYDRFGTNGILAGLETKYNFQNQLGAQRAGLNNMQLPNFDNMMNQGVNQQYLQPNYNF